MIRHAVSVRARELINRWAARHEEWSRLGVEVDGAAVAKEVIADIERLIDEGFGERLTCAEAAALTGYSVDHIGRLIREGKLRNVGRKGAPRVLENDLPLRPQSRLAENPERPYDPNSDARFLRVRR